MRKTRALETALNHDHLGQGPALVDVIVNPQELLISPTIYLEQIRDHHLVLPVAALVSDDRPTIYQTIIVTDHALTNIGKIVNTKVTFRISSVNSIDA